MKKLNFKLFLIISFVVVGVFYLFFLSPFLSNAKVLAQAQAEITVYTTGYSVLSSDIYIFAGAYSDNMQRKAFTTYFEFKKDDPNFEKDKEETIKIVRNSNIEEFGNFYTNPELKLFSTYYFRAVGYFNDNPNQKFYGSAFSLRTGYIPPGAAYPFSVGVDGVVVPYTPPTCTPTQELVYGICKDKTSPPTTTPTTTSPTTSTTPPTVSPTPSPNPAGSNSGLVPCGTEVANGKITNPCGFEHIFTLINKIVNFLLFTLAIPISAIMFAYAGFLMMVPGGESASKKTKGKGIFLNVAIGLAFAAGAWLIIHTILSILEYTGEWFGFK